MFLHPKSERLHHVIKAKPGRGGVPLPGQGSEEEEEEKEEGEGGMEKEARRREEILSSFS